MKKNWLKYVYLSIGVFVIRLLPFRAPNLEPILAAQMPLARQFGALSTFLFGAVSIVAYDSVTSGLGIWTIVTASVYGVMGIGAHMYFKNHTGQKSYVLYAIGATLAYDVLTGLTIGPLFFHQSFISAVVGQIPFTFIHLLGNVSFAIVLSPVIERWIVSEKKSEIIRSIPIIVRV